MIELPWPPASLSGHNEGNRWSKAPIVAKHRAWAKAATLAAKIAAPRAGDIRVIVTFYPPNRRSDRVNFPNRMKPFFDGIADALKVNDSRFLPSYLFAEPVKDGRVSVDIIEHEARAIGDIVAPIAALTLAKLLPYCPTVEDRKGLIMDARQHGVITDDEAEMLIQANQLETA